MKISLYSHTFTSQGECGASPLMNTSVLPYLWQNVWMDLKRKLYFGSYKKTGNIFCICFYIVVSLLCGGTVWYQIEYGVSKQQPEYVL